jgi:hypothetical protein
MVPQLLSPSRLVRWTGLRFAGGIFVGKWSRHMDNQHLRQLSRASETWPLRSCTSPPARPNGENEPGVQNPHQLRNGRTTTQFTQTGSLGAKEKIIRNSPNKNRNHHKWCKPTIPQQISQRLAQSQQRPFRGPTEGKAIPARHDGLRTVHFLMWGFHKWRIPNSWRVYNGKFYWNLKFTMWGLQTIAKLVNITSITFGFMIRK